ncbi:MAG: hypothetical protein JEZ03_18590 [Bacteroidales bacterium]|nr:hypothetical protein [Bacteroidales bacterium]
MKAEKTIVFEPFVRFVIEFHNKSMRYAKLLRTKVQHVDAFTSEDIELIEEAFLIKHVAEWEIFIQNIFAYCIAIDTTAICNHLELDLSKKISFDNAYAILNGLNFFTATSTSELKGLAKKIITEKNNPFTQFDKTVLNNVDEVYILRNYIAHKSKKSKQRLQKMYKDRYRLTDFQNPGHFLRQEIKDDVDASLRSDLYYGTFMTISTSIWKHLDPDSYKFVFEDDNSAIGLIRGIGKMSLIFERLSKENHL